MVRRGPVGEGIPPFEEGVPLSLTGAWVDALDDLDELCGWLGSFRARLLSASNDGVKTDDFATVISQLESRLRRRRAELA